MLPWLPPNWILPNPLYAWTDQLWRAGYRLQSHAEGDMWRVLCPRDERLATGHYQSCLTAFERFAGPAKRYTSADHVVILLHGLLRTRRCMKPLARALTQAGMGPAIRPDYASTRMPIREDAAALRRLVEGLEGDPKISFVGHSMGNIVIRHAIGDWLAAGDPAGVLNRLHRVVMLGPPNQGAAIARQLGALGVFHMVAGHGGRQLGLDWETLKPHLAIPPCPFAILAGDLTPFWANNPLLGKANDFLVTVDEARLAGAVDFVTLPILHAALMSDPRVLAYASEFLTCDDPTKSLPAIPSGTRLA